MFEVPSISSSGFLPTLGRVRSPLVEAAQPGVTPPRPLGQKDEGDEQHGHAEQQAVVRRAAAAHAFLQLGNFGVKFVCRKEGKKERKKA